MPTPSASRRVAVVEAASEDPVDEQHDPEREGRRPTTNGTEARVLRRRQGRALAHRCDRRNAGRLDRRAEAREQRDDDAGEEADDDRPGGEDRPALRELDAECDEQRVEALRETESEDEPENGRDDSDDERLEHHTLRTWRREPPIVRSVANSRTRCAMVIESVLAMTKRRRTER